MNKKFKLEELGRGYARCIFYNDKNGKLIKKYPKNNVEADIILETLDKPIIVYNPNLEKKKEIEIYISKNFNSDKTEINIEPIDLVLDLLPMTTNIEYELDRNNKEDMAIIARQNGGNLI